MPELVVPVSGTITASDGSILNLEGSLMASYTPPLPPAPALPIFGFNDKVDGGIAQVAVELGCKPITGAKMFDQTMPSVFPAPPAPGVTHTLLCVKPSVPMTAADKTALASLAKSAPPHAMLTACQEGEHDGFTSAEIKAVHAEAYDIVKAAAPGVLYGQCFMSFSASGKSPYGALSEWVGIQTSGKPLDFYGFDTYPWAATEAAGSVLDACLAELKTVVPHPVVAVTECNDTSNIATASVYEGGGAQWFSEAWAWAEANAALLFFVFAATARGVPWPPDAATIAELSKIAHASGL